MKRTHRTAAATALTVLASVLTAAPARADTIADFCPGSGGYGGVHYWNQPITDSAQWTEFDWYAPPKDPVVEESVTFTVIASRLDGSHSHTFELDAWSRSNPYGGYEIYGRDEGYGPADTGRWKIDGEGACADIYYSVFAAGRFTAPVAPVYAVAGTPFTVGSTVRGWNSAGVEAPVAGVLVDVDRTPLVGGYPKVDVARVRTDAYGRARTSVTVYSNTRFFQDNVLETASRHNPDPMVGPVVYVRKRITRAISDSTPAVGQTVTISGSVLPAGGPAYLQRWDGTKFVSIAATTQTSAGRYAFSYRPATRGHPVLRVFTPFTSWNVSSASANIYLTVG
jgi:hypothetical protein